MLLKRKQGYKGHQPEDKRPEGQFGNKVVPVIDKVQVRLLTQRKDVGIQSGEEDDDVHDQIEILDVHQSCAGEEAPHPDMCQRDHEKKGRACRNNPGCIEPYFVGPLFFAGDGHDLGK